MKLFPEETTHEKETTMELSTVCSPVADSFPFGEVPEAKKSHEQIDLDGWPGRFWLPAHSQVPPTGNACLSHAFGQARESAPMVLQAAP